MIRNHPIVRVAAFLCWMLACLFCWNGNAQGGSPEALFEQANRSYEQGKYAEAVQTYSQLVQSGKTSPALYFNLGNACYKSGRIGDALGYYLIAERSTPRDPDLQANLRFVRSVVYGGAFPDRKLPGRWVAKLSLNEWALFFGLSLWIFFGVLSWRLLRPASRFGSRNWVFLAVAALALAAGGLGFSCYDRFGDARVVVNRRDVILHHGPVTESPSLQTLADGQELRVLDTKNDWLQVSGASRGVGWVRKPDVWLLPR